jgi:hypothetical protein
MVLSVTVTPALAASSGFIGRALSFEFLVQTTVLGAPGQTGGAIQPTRLAQPQTIKIPPGLMAQARITFAGLPSAAALQCTIWGLTPAIMNQLNTLSSILQMQPANLVTVYASNADGTNRSIAFKGGILNCTPDFNRQPEAPINIQAYAALDIATLPSKPKSYEGTTDITTAIGTIAAEVKYDTEFNGISGISLSRSYLDGSPRDQVANIARAVKDRGIMVDFVENNTIAVWSLNKGRAKPVPTISPDSGLIGYPTYTGFGIDVRTIYNPNIVQGGQVQVNSSLPGASGLFTVYGVSHDLDAQIPGGKWETMVHAYRLGYPTPPITPP